MAIDLLTQKRVIELTGIPRTTLWRMRERGDFPSAVQVADHNIMFVATDVERWLRRNPVVPRVHRDPVPATQRGHKGCKG